MSIENLNKEDLLFFIKCYNNYIIEFYEEHEEGMQPVSVYEFYDNEFQEIILDNIVNEIYLAEDFVELLNILDNMEQDLKIQKARNLVSHTFTHISEEEEDEELSNIKEQVIEILEKESE